MAKVRQNTIDCKKGAMKVTTARKDNLTRELGVIQEVNGGLQHGLQQSAMESLCSLERRRT